jgi:5-methylcytosine-specific restriction enzyme A
MPKINSIKPRISKIDTRQGSEPASQRIRGNTLIKIRRRIILRDGFTCQICGRVTDRGEVDHKTPLHQGGKENDENRWYLCVDCHESKTEQEQKHRG